jgi:UDP-glucose 4-epimerase
MSEQERIVVTGIGGRLGRLLVKHLHRREGVELIGIDRRKIHGLPRDVEHLRVDIRSKRARDVFRTRPVTALIHLGLMHDPRVSPAEHHSWNVVGTQRLLDYCADFDVNKVVMLSSADVYGPRADNQQFLTEEAPLLGAVDFPAIRDLVTADMQVTNFFWRAHERRGAHGQPIETVVLRPVHILGAVRNAASNYLRLPRCPVLMGYDPMIQVVHERDVIEALLLALRPGAHGIFNITGPGEVPLSAILQELGKDTVPVPAPALDLALRVGWKLHLTSFPVPELALIRYVGMVDGGRARDKLDYRPRYSLPETLWAVCESEPRGA